MEIDQNVILLIIGGLATLVSAGFLFLKYLGQKAIDGKITDDRVRGILSFLLDRAHSVVQGLQQEVVAELKEKLKDGKLTDEEKQELKEKAVKLVVDALTPDQLKLLETVAEIDVEKQVNSMVETAVFNIK